MRRCYFAVEVVLVRWRNQAVLLGIVGDLLILSSRNVDLLSLAANRGLDIHLMMFNASWIHSLVVNYVYAIIRWALVGLVEILSGLIKLMNVLDVLHILLAHRLDLDVVELVGVLDVLVEASSSGPSSRICRCLSLPFDAFNDFACLLVDTTKWINCITVLGTMINNSVGHLGSLLAWHTYLIRLANKHLIRGCMIHILFINCRCNIHVIVISHDDLVVHLVLADICRVLLSLSSDHVVEAIWNVVGSTDATVCTGVLWVLWRDINNGRVDNFRLVNAAIATLLCYYWWSLLLVVLGRLYGCLEGLLRDDLSCHVHRGSLQGYWIVLLSILWNCIKVIFR